MTRAILTVLAALLAVSPFLGEASEKDEGLPTVFESYSGRIPGLTKVRSVTFGDGHLCAIGESGTRKIIRCLGDQNWGRADLTGFKNPMAIGVGFERACVIDDHRLKCWKLAYSERNAEVVDLEYDVYYPSAPDHPLYHPRNLAVEFECACVIHDQGLACWDLNGYTWRCLEKAKPPTRSFDVLFLIDLPFSKPEVLSMSTEHIYVIDGGEVRFLGKPEMAPKELPSFRNPRRIATQWNQSCAIDDEGVKCWQVGKYSRIQEVPPLLNPREVGVNDYAACAIDDHGVTCWKGNDASIRYPVPDLRNPRDISMNWSYACATDDAGARCWAIGRETGHFTPIKFSEIRLDSLANGLYPEKAGFLEKVVSVLKTLPYSRDLKSDRYFVFSAIRPVMENVRTRQWESEILPGYEAILEEAEYERQAVGLAGFERSAKLQRIALQLIAIGLTSGRELIASPSDRVKAEELIRALGQALSASDDDLAQAVVGVINRLEASKALLDLLVANPRLRGFGLMVRELTEYLEGPVETPTKP